LCCFKVRSKSWSAPTLCSKSNWFASFSAETKPFGALRLIGFELSKVSKVSKVTKQNPQKKFKQAKNKIEIFNKNRF
jgi:hypothetical protein